MFIGRFVTVTVTLFSVATSAIAAPVGLTRSGESELRAFAATSFSSDGPRLASPSGGARWQAELDSTAGSVARASVDSAIFDHGVSGTASTLAFANGGRADARGAEFIVFTLTEPTEVVLVIDIDLSATAGLFAMDSSVSGFVGLTSGGQTAVLDGRDAALSADLTAPTIGFADAVQLQGVLAPGDYRIEWSLSSFVDGDGISSGLLNYQLVVPVPASAFTVLASAVAMRCRR